MRKYGALFLLLLLIVFSCARNDRPFDMMVDRIVKDFNERVQKEYGLLPMGYGGEFMTNVNKIILSYLCYEGMDLEKAREVLVNCVESLLKDVNEHEKIRPYLNNFPFTVSNIQFSFSLAVEGPGAQYQDELALVQLEEGKIYYLQRKKGENVFSELLQESYPEALEIVKSTGGMVEEW